MKLVVLGNVSNCGITVSPCDINRVKTDTSRDIKGIVSRDGVSTEAFGV
jgi:hypothetical protein